MTDHRKSGYAALIGRPNVGKSTLMNALIGQKIAITSHRPQTTRNRIRTFYTDERGQIIFTDTPGIHRPKNKLGSYMQKAVEHTLADSDILLWLVEPDVHIGSGDRLILERLSHVSAPVFLLINKTDTVPKERIARVIEAYAAEREFDEIIPVSALKKTNLDDLLTTIFAYLPEGPAYYEEDMVTDVPLRRIAEELIREKALRNLQEEIPHGIAVVIERMQEREGDICDIEAVIICEKQSHKGIIIGKNGEMLKKIGSAARYEIERQMMMKVNLKLWVKVREDWRDNEAMLREYGYQKEDE